jgi:hypothetical protein
VKGSFSGAACEGCYLWRHLARVLSLPPSVKGSVSGATCEAFCLWRPMSMAAHAQVSVSGSACTYMEGLISRAECVQSSALWQHIFRAPKDPVSLATNMRGPVSGSTRAGSYL